MTTVSDIGEKALIQRICAALAEGATYVGDDAAVCAPAPGGYVFATDTLVENVDFDFAWATWNDVGAKAVAVNLSDMAAMGARPAQLVLTLGCRRHDAVADVLKLVRSAVRVAEEHDTMIVGGDITSTEGPLFVGLAAVGHLDPRHTPLQRYRGEPGDVIMVSGGLGGASAGLLCLESGITQHPALTRRQLQPTPRVALGLALARAGSVSSCTDLSDGLVSDVGHVLAEGCGATIDVRKLPYASGVRGVAKILDGDALPLVLAGGEDFELLWTAPESCAERLKRAARRAGVKATIIGKVRAQPGCLWIGMKDTDTVPTSGYEHFKTRRVLT